MPRLSVVVPTAAVVVMAALGYLGVERWEHESLVNRSLSMLAGDDKLALGTIIRFLKQPSADKELIFGGSPKGSPFAWLRNTSVSDDASRLFSYYRQATACLKSRVCDGITLCSALVPEVIELGNEITNTVDSRSRYDGSSVGSYYTTDADRLLSACSPYFR
jgi:hypothetical protein